MLTNLIMCGILGILPGENNLIFNKALNKLEHRGPDGSGTWHAENQSIILGHRRLSILDTSDNGRQPMRYGNYVIIFNGEIYNFLEIKQQLKNKGYTFSTESDTEVILVSFIEYGPSCLLKFNGMWALAIWDISNQQLFLARDRFGVKPLFYAFVKDRFIFASETKAIMPFLPQVKPSRDFEWCKNNLLSYESTDKCLIEGIQRFPAGHYANLDLKNKKLNFTRYWNTLDHLTDVPPTYGEQVEYFRELFLDACKIRMRADVPIGTTLSGGVDSSSIVCAMANIQADSRTSKDWQHAFVATFPGTSLDESEFAKKVVAHTGIQAYYTHIDAENGLKNLDKYMYLFEELHLTSPVPMMDNYKSVRDKGVVVTIDGHGADEMLCGYGGTILLALQDCGFSLKEISNIIKTFKGQLDANPTLKKQGKKSFTSQLKFLYNKYHSKKDFLALYLQALLTKTIQESPKDGVLGHFNQKLYEDFHVTILPTLLRNYDRYSMAHGIEVRMPFMDYRLVSFCFSLTWQSKLKKGYTKTILRDAMQPYVPKEIIWRKSKVGFNTPFTDWMKGSWKNYLTDLVNSTEFTQSALIEAAVAKSIVMQVINNPKASYKDGEKAWRAIVPYFWEKAMLKNNH